MEVEKSKTDDHFERFHLEVDGQTRNPLSIE